MQPFPIEFLKRIANSRNIPHGNKRKLFLHIYSDCVDKTYKEISDYLNMSSPSNVRHTMSKIYDFFNDVIGSEGSQHKREQLYSHLEEEYLWITKPDLIPDTIYHSPAHFTAAHFANGKQYLYLLEHLNTREWSDIFCLVMDKLSHHDAVDFIQLMRDRIDNLLSGDLLLQQFLFWVQKQSELLLNDINQNICSTAVRGCYFDFDIVLDINRSLSSEIEPEFTRDFICASLIARVEQSNVRITFPKLEEIRGLREEYGIDPAMAIAFGQSKVVQALIEKLDSSSLKASLKQLQQEIIPLIPPLNGEEPVGRLTKDIELWGEELRDVIVPYWSLGEEWRYPPTENEEDVIVFSDEQRDKLKDYYYANKILIRCLMSKKVPEDMRNNILSSLLLPIVEEDKVNEDRIVNYEPLFYIPKTLNSELKTSEKFAYILNISKENIHQFEDFISDININFQTLIDAVFIDKNAEAMLEIHKILFQIYETSLSHPLSAICTHEHSTWLVNIRDQIETAWIDSELQRLEGETGSIPPESVTEDPEAICEWIKEQANYRSEVDRQILEFFKNEARDEHFKIFVQSDAMLNYRFCDALALAQIHFSEVIKAEIVHNMWDETGHGIPFKLHSREFTRILNDLNLEQPKACVWGQDWRPYYGHNLYFLFGLNRKHFFKALGSLTMPELFDPRRDQAIVDGLKRVYSNSVNYNFYAHHIETDMRHGQSWLENIICPIVRYQKEIGKEIAIGCILRMNTMRYYNQYLMDRFRVENAKILSRINTQNLY